MEEQQKVKCCWCGKEYFPEEGFGDYCCRRCCAEDEANEEKLFNKEQEEKRLASIEEERPGKSFGCLWFIIAVACTISFFVYNLILKK